MPQDFEPSTDKEQPSNPRELPELDRDGRLGPEIFDLEGGSDRIQGARGHLEARLGAPLPDAAIFRLFGGIKGSSIKIKPAGNDFDIWTAHAWFESPLYFSIEFDPQGADLVINDFFLKPTAPRMLGTRIMANTILQAAKIQRMNSILASATRMYFGKDDELVREVNGYYFFPRLGFNAKPKNADDYIEIPENIKGKNLLDIMQDPDFRQWWKENGQTIDVKFKLKSERSLQALHAYLAENNIQVDTGG